jgi:hypothetical protein
MGCVIVGVEAKEMMILRRNNYLRSLLELLPEEIPNSSSCKF